MYGTKHGKVPSQFQLIDRNDYLMTQRKLKRLVRLSKKIIFQISRVEVIHIYSGYLHARDQFDSDHML